MKVESFQDEPKLSEQRLSSAADADQSESATGSGETVPHTQANENDSSTSDYTGNGYSTRGSEEELDEARKIAEKETYNVRLWRFITTDVIIMTACTVVLSTYAILRNFEYQDFQEAYALSSESLATALEKLHSVNAAALIGFAASISASASAYSAIGGSGSSNSSVWPLFLPPDFQARADLVTQLSTFEMLYYAPLITEENELAYLSFADQLVAKETSQAWYGYHPFITRFESSDDKDTETGFVQATSSQELYFPTLSSYPPDPSFEILNWDLTDLATSSSSSSNATSKDLLQELTLLGSNHTLLVPPVTTGSYNEDAISYMLSPILDQDTTEIVGLIAGGLSFSRALKLKGILTEHSQGLVVVVTYNEQCNPNSNNASSTGSYTYQIEGPELVFQSPGDLHDTHYDDYEVQVDLGNGIIATQCQVQMSIYPSRSLELGYRTHFPEIFSLVLAFAFIVVAAAFFKYDILVDRRNEKLIDKFARSNAIVSSLFPKMYRDRLMGNDEDEDAGAGGKAIKRHSSTGKLKSLMSSDHAKTFGPDDKNSSTRPSKPLADIFPAVSIIFADIAGFTAWSSSREPHQVFTLLETLYTGFDDIARRRRIFKVETIGDCYVAATGLPEPRRDHAVAMVRFGSDIIHRMQVLTRELEVLLGPDTGDLSLRVGIHSGTVTAGILRGQKARFQLFGDAMNTASRIESNGMPGRIQVSQATADLLIKSGHEHWLQKRPEKIAAKGKGLIQTYWVTRSVGGRHSSESSSTTSSGSEIFTNSNSNINNNLEADAVDQASNGNGSNNAVQMLSIQQQIQLKRCEHDARIKRLVDWNVETLVRLIKLIIAHRQAHNEVVAAKGKGGSFSSSSQHVTRKFPLDEVKEIITLPEFQRATKQKVNPANIEIPANVVEQLRSFVGVIGRHYKCNHFHNFDHASHVAMSVSKLLSRIVDPRDDDTSPDGKAAHDHTYGITSDPLTQFACVFSALIHDVDHSGVPNAQLVKEKTDIASQYNNRSVAEQHSLDLSWDYFMSSEYEELRNTICATPSELNRLREIVVNAVMATDIADKELKTLRNSRWEKAFATGITSSSDGDAVGKVEVDSNPRDAVNRKATIVIEHLMQASDVAHTMQHWHVYRKWNERLLREVYKAYKEGRQERNPLHGWYQGEIGFFDFYIIPLAKKLKDCGVFGVSSDEYLNYARNNREEWEERGREMVAAVAESLEKEYKEHERNHKGCCAVDLE